MKYIAYNFTNTGKTVPHNKVLFVAPFELRLKALNIFSINHGNQRVLFDLKSS